MHFGMPFNVNFCYKLLDNLGGMPFNDFGMPFNVKLDML